MKTETPDWIVIASRGSFLVVDNESLKQDGIIAHALNSVHRSCESAKHTAEHLNSGKPYTGLGGFGSQTKVN